MFNYNVNANVDNGTCLPYIYGCTDPTAWNYDSLANTSVGCIPFYYGCTDPTAFNYDPNANTDNGTCIPIVIPCCWVSTSVNKSYTTSVIYVSIKIVIEHCRVCTS